MLQAELVKVLQTFRDIRVLRSGRVGGDVPDLTLCHLKLLFCDQPLIAYARQFLKNDRRVGTGGVDDLDATRRCCRLR